jgi:hypothetical protein
VAVILDEHQERVLDTGSASSILIRRHHVFEDAMKWYQRPDFDVSKVIKVNFPGEMMMDLGGPRRDFFEKLIGGLANSGLFEGEEGHLLPSPILSNLLDKSVFQAGRMVASCICQGGPAPRLFHPFIEELISGKDIQPKLDDIPRRDVKTMLKKVIHLVPSAPNL